MSSTVSNELSDEAIRWVVRLRSGTLTSAEREACATWRACDAEHERAYQEARGIWDAASGLEASSASGLVRVAPLGQEVCRQHERRPRHPQRILRVAASMLLAVGLGAWLIADRNALLADYATHLRETRTVPLVDGSRVDLAPDTAIDIDMKGRARRILLRAGRAFFKVTRDPAGRPFEVVAGDATVTVLGTAFEVDRRDDGSTTVTVSEHAVSVQTRAGQVFTVHEGSRLVLDATGTSGAILPLNVAHVAMWRHGQLVAEGEPLNEVLAALSHYRRGWIMTPGEDLSGISVNAVLDLNDPDASLHALSAAAPIRIRSFTPYLTVVAPGN
jgi:transmembrane sensor